MRLEANATEKLFNECCVTSEGLIMRGLWIVLPHSLQLLAVKLAHEGHLGICKTKALLRAKVCFPNIYIMVEKEIILCKECQINEVQVCQNLYK